MIRLYEKYRPVSLDEVVGQDKAVGKVRTIMGRGIGGRAFWLSGSSGVGKTTLARIIARSVAEEFCITEYDSADQFGQAEVDAMMDGMGMYGMGKGGRAWIVNEAHGLRKPIIRQLLGILERLPAHAVIVFTTTKDGQDALFEDEIDASPLLSRCIPITLTNQGLNEAFAERVRMIAVAEGIDGKPIEAYKRLAKDCKNNCRAMLQKVEIGDF